MTHELALSRATAGGALGFAARCQSWFLRRGRWSRRLILVIFGALAALAFPPVNALPLFAVGLVALIWAAETAERRRCALGVGGGWGCGRLVAGCFWLADAFLAEACRCGWRVPFVIARLAAYMAVYPALAVAAAWHRNAPPLARVLLLAAAWTVAEWLRGHLFTGFPWNLPAYVWSVNLPMMQSAALWGAWGLCFVTILLCGVLSLMGRGDRRNDVRAGGATLAVIVLLYGFGAWRLA